MDREALKGIQSGTVDEVRDMVDGIEDPADLEVLRELEHADGTPRKGVLDAIDKRATEIAPPPEPATGKSKRAAAPAAEAPAWQARDYIGPLTGDQAAWRNANLKPVEKVATK